MSLWGEEFELPKDNEQRIITKVKSPKKAVVVERAVNSKTISFAERLELIKQEVYRILGRFRNNICVIRTRQELHDYISGAIAVGAIALDTETNNSLEPWDCLIAGACIYTEGQKQAYVPINHIDPKTGERISEQLTENDLNKEFARLKDTKIIYHNAKFDFEVFECTCGIKLNPYWDTMIAAKILDENEHANLKEQYIKHIDPTIEKYSIENLFEKQDYLKIPPELFAYYASTDAYMTYRLWQYQEQLFSLSENQDLLNLYLNVEMPMIEVLASMEITGCEIDTEVAKRLSVKYHKLLDEAADRANEALKEYDDRVAEWRGSADAQQKVGKKTKSEQLGNPINLESTTQLAILVYDVLKTPSTDRKKPRSVDKEALAKMPYALCERITEKKAILKLLNTYIDKIPQSVCPKDNRLHGRFNQYGAATGRLSSDSPNLQNLPSKNKEVRLLFKAGDGKVLVGADYSQQEPRLLCSYAKDEAMLNAYRNNKDLYATIAAKVYHNDYWDNMEHTESGEDNVEGAKRRKKIKSVVLGILYGMQAPSMAEQIGSTVQEAQKIIDDFYKAFPAIKKWVDKTNADCKKNGYVEGLLGRRRRLPDMQLEPFEIVSVSDKNKSPFLYCKGNSDKTTTLIESFKTQLKKCKRKSETELVVSQANKNGLKVRFNSSLIAQAERQCVNARVQGGAATITKIAMRKIYDDGELNRLGFKLLITIHDEVIGECPEENALRVSERLCEVMRTAVEDIVVCPMKCDPTIEKNWYTTEYIAGLKEKIQKKGLSFDELCNEHSEFTRGQLSEMLI